MCLVLLSSYLITERSELCLFIPAEEVTASLTEMKNLLKIGMGGEKLCQTYRALKQEKDCSNTGEKTALAKKVAGEY